MRDDLVVVPAAHARQLALATGAVVATLGTLVLFVGWGTGVTRLTDVVAGSASMKANTALAFIFEGTALAFLTLRHSVWQRLGRVLAAAGALVGGVSAFEYVTAIDLGIDQLLAADTVTRSFPGRMAPITATSFAAIGLALLGVRARAVWLSQVPALFVGVSSFVALIGYGYGTETLYSFGPYGSIAIHTAVAFITLAIGLIAARPFDGITGMLTSPGPGGLLARRLLPVAILLPPVLGWVRLVGQQAGLYDTQFGVAVFAATLTVVLIIVTMLSARSIDRMDFQQRRMERDLESARRDALEREINLAAVVDASEDAIVGTSVVGIIRTWNGGAERLYGYTADEAIGQPMRMLVPPHLREEAETILAACAAGERIRNAPTVRLTKNGALVDVSVSVSPIRSAAGAIIGVSAIARDMTDQLQVEERFRLAVEASPSGVLLVDDAGRIVLSNRELERMFGYKSHEVIGQRVELLVPDRSRSAHIDLRAGFRVAPGQRRMGQGRDVHGRRKDGTEFPAEIGLNPLQTRQGPLTLAVIVDVSDRQAMMRQVEAQTAELQRSNDELMQFAYVVSHDLQEPLRMVASYTELFATRYQGHIDERADKYVRYITEGANRMQQLIRDLLVFARVGRQNIPRVPVDMNVVCQRVLTNLKPLIESSGAVVAVNHLPTVLSNETHVGQILQNLIANAIKFRGSAPPQVVVAADQVRGMAQISVEDNGIGIDMKFHDRVFEVFQRLHGRDEYEGTGVGLAVVKRIVERHGGRVWFESKPGNGTRFHFTLPIADVMAS
jgi:PAS domain S-box-containing protein